MGAVERADVATHFEFLSAFYRFQTAAVYLAIVRVHDVTAVPDRLVVNVLSKVAQDGQPDQRFVFAFVTALVFILLTIFDFALPLAYGLDQPSLDFDLLWDIGVNIAISALSAAIAWKTNGDRWINRPDTIKLDLDE